METNTPTTRQWMLAVFICGSGACISFAMAMFGGISLRVSYIFFMAFGPFFGAAVFALYKFLRRHHDGILLQIGALLMIVATGIVTIMASMQGALRIYFNDLPHDASVAEAAPIAWKMGLHAGNALQLGADVAWDIFMFSGLLLWGITLRKYPGIGPWFGWSAVLIGVAGLVLNLWTFPTPPAEAGLVDVGPLVGVWFGVIGIPVIRIYIKSYKAETASVPTA